VQLATLRHVVQLATLRRVMQLARLRRYAMYVAIHVTGTR